MGYLLETVRDISRHQQTSADINRHQPWTLAALQPQTTAPAPDRRTVVEETVMAPVGDVCKKLGPWTAWTDKSSLVECQQGQSQLDMTSHCQCHEIVKDTTLPV